MTKQEEIRGIGVTVKCLNCGILWVRITPDSNPGGTVFNADLMYNCPNCYSNYFEVATEPLIEKKNAQ